ncbi:LysE family translocator [Cupriavidus pampae]|uniref:Cysteine/O-acetylserine efflux protein n=1 Tax=Cupriavidus pampae TaxID=659251 RepID=A0ABM8W9X5_9BURK|nr:LysE family translocator [Cupriavidus pampae]CAG9164041.1 Cysteine/O-acetylserine efflux protein [Cupriavidus pampae]
MNPALLPFLLFAFVASITPGPTNILVFSNSARRGVSASVPMILGGCGGAALLVLVVGLGIGHTLAQHPDIQRVMAWAGALWLTRMAWQLFRSAPTQVEVGAAPAARPLGFTGAAGLQIVNPKTWVMGIAVVSLFAGHGADQTHDVALLSLVFFCVALPCMFLWACLGAAAARLLRSADWMKRFDRLMAVLLLGSAWWGFLG